MLTDVGQLQFSGMTWFSNYLFNRKLVGKSLKGKTASAGPRYASSNCQDCKLNLAEICACVRSSILATCLLYVSVSLLPICKSGFCIKLKLPQIELLTTMKNQIWQYSTSSMDPNLNRSSLSEGWTFTSVQILDSRTLPFLKENRCHQILTGRFPHPLWSRCVRWGFNYKIIVLKNFLLRCRLKDPLAAVPSQMLAPSQGNALYAIGK